jgi:hypothetical protein
LLTLRHAVVPKSDIYDLAYRLLGKVALQRTLPPPEALYQVGDRQLFWVGNADSDEHAQVPATLRYVTDHLYFWVQDGASYNPGELRDLAQAFESAIYPTTRAFFGSEWSPGVDGDEHIYILYASHLGRTLAGFFSSVDEYTPSIFPYSNAHEIFFLNADRVDLGKLATYGVLAHEFQHMIQWNIDRDEETWLNEGFSELSAFLNGYGLSRFDEAYARNPDVRLDDWPAQLGETARNYGASYLFMSYFLSRFGEQVTKAVVADPANGLESFDQVLQAGGATDPLTGKPIGVDDVFADWVIASYLRDETVGDGRYAYRVNPDVPKFVPTETLSDCPLQAAERNVQQYGVDYIRITCQGDYLLHFAGTSELGVLPVDAYSGEYLFWSNRGDEADMTLTRLFDFTDQSGPLTLIYWTLYDLEQNYDYVYLEASLDGKNWQILKTPSGTEENASGNSFGWAYNGYSGLQPEWILEEVDLSEFAGHKVSIRFEYITDPAVNGEGFLLDDVFVPQIGYFTDFENDDGGWQAEGFVRIRNILPQTYRLALITIGKDTSVEHIPLGMDMTAEVPIHIGGNIKEVVLVVSGTTRFTRQKANYWVSVIR